LLRAEDIKGTTPAAATKALARLAKQGVLTRVGKGLYFAPKETLIGQSRPSEFDLARKTLEGKTRPRGATAANILGLSTQVSARPQVVVFANNFPKHTGSAKIQIRRGSRPHNLPELEGALIEFVRERGSYAETEPLESYERLRRLLKNMSQGNLRELREVAQGEPPRVRAILGALFSYSGLAKSLWEPLKESLNPLTRFDFGHFAELPNAREWQAK